MAGYEREVFAEPLTPFWRGDYSSVDSLDPLQSRKRWLARLGPAFLKIIVRARVTEMKGEAAVSKLPLLDGGSSQPR